MSLSICLFVVPSSIHGIACLFIAFVSFFTTMLSSTWCNAIVHLFAHLEPSSNRLKRKSYKIAHLQILLISLKTFVKILSM
jgi:hypothetical protein